MGATIFSVVYTVTDWYDGPRQGIADYQGRPHYFESQWQDGNDLDCDTYLLMPIDDDTFSLALEDWAIWRRWETAFHQGKATQQTHPALPEDRARHEELVPLLKERLVVDVARSVRKRAEFRPRSDPDWNGCGWSPLEVQWQD
jgi:hypothetical protein